MHQVPKRLLFVGAAPLALAAVYGGSLAFAQAPAVTPTAPKRRPRSARAHTTLRRGRSNSLLTTSLPERGGPFNRPPP